MDRIFYIITKGRVSDRAFISIDNNITNFVEVINKDSNLNFTKQQFSGSGNEHI
jgi:hypothetical protein